MKYKSKFIYELNELLERSIVYTFKTTLSIGMKFSKSHTVILILYGDSFFSSMLNLFSPDVNSISLITF